MVETRVSRLMGLNLQGLKLSMPSVRDPRACILVKDGLNCLLAYSLCFRDLLAAKVWGKDSG